ncbi:MAG: radical SAM family heme chaperone HemW [bacterium]|jgi:oxygen-independent coproporphyrinogen-3 oxidase|nr:radical SAM family heme chaperone HemW [bacterium]
MNTDPSQPAQNVPPLGIYIHIPFCQSKCHYCAFVSGPARSEEAIDRYVQAIQRHLVLDAAHCASREIHSVFLGGGTPSSIGAERLDSILQTLQTHFQLGSGAEITVEVNPESTSPAFFAQLRQAGVNRVSMGAQSFSPEILHRLGRIHSVEAIATCVRDARVAGMDSVSLDLIFGIPGQTLADWRNTLQRALETPIDHLSAYGLSYEEGTRFHHWLQTGAVTAVLEETFCAMYDETQTYLRQRGWVQYEISNWCKPGKECRHNLLYWNRDEYLALGVSGYGMYNNRLYGLIPDQARYVTALEHLAPHGGSPFPIPGLLQENRGLSAEEMASDRMIFGLRKCQGVSRRWFLKRTGYDPHARWALAIEELQQAGMLVVEADRIRLAESAFLLSNEVFEKFLD